MGACFRGTQNVEGFHGTPLRFAQEALRVDRTLRSMAFSQSHLVKASTVCGLISASFIGFPHAWVSGWLVLAGIFIALCVSKAKVAPQFRFLVFSAWCFAVCVVARFAMSLIASAPLSFSGFGHYFAVAAMVLLAVRIAPFISTERATLTIVASAVLIPILFTVSQFVEGKDHRVLRSYQTYSGNDSIWIGIALAIAAAGCTLEAVRNVGRKRSATCARYWVLAAGFTFFLTQAGHSRMGLLIFLIATATGVLLIPSTTPLQRNAKIASVLGALVLCLGSPTARDGIRVAALEVEGAIVRHEVHHSTSQGQRLALFSVSKHIWLEAPVFGHGLGTWRSEFSKKVPPQWVNAIGSHSSPHNEYVHILTQMGIVGFFAFLMLLLAFGLTGYRALRLAGSPWLYVLSVAAACASITNVFFWDFRFFSPFSAWILCALAAVSTASDRSKNR